MPDNRTDRHPILACPLWEKTSAKGETYLVGRMGHVRVLVFRSREEGEGTPTHKLMFTEAPPTQKKDEPRAKPQEKREESF